MTASPALNLAMVAGEASGDVLAGLLLHHKLAVHGFGWDVLLRLREILGIRNALDRRLAAQPPALFVGVDAPDFNLALEARLRARGVKTVHFVCPSVWAWRAERLRTLQRSVDHVLCLFPFEPALLAQHGIAATYVGHPLAQVIPLVPDRLAARAHLGLAPDAQVLALLPGSRLSEINNLAGVFFQAAARIAAQRAQVQFVVPAAPGMQDLIRQAAQSAGMAGRVHIVAGQSHAVLAACDATLIASGTATLEAALFKRPMVIAYRMGTIAWQLMNRKRLQAWVGLPNILCQDFVVPEFLQSAARPDALAAACLQWLDAKAHNPTDLHDLEQRFLQLHHTLRQDTGALAAQAIENTLHA